jgi:hypothetical protein
MKRRSRFGAFPLLFVLAVVSIAATSPILLAQNQHPRFTAPELLTASDIAYPINSGAAGVVAIAVNLDSAGLVKETDVVRDIPSLTAPVLLSIQKWTFKPARLDGKRVDSTIIVSIAFNPSDYQLTGTGTPALGKELKILSPDAAGFLPPRTIDASWAVYPVNSVAQGTVILEARVNHAGRVTHVTPAWNPYLTRTSVSAAEKWTFEAAAFEGMPITATAIIGYVFRPPNTAARVAP